MDFRKITDQHILLLVIAIAVLVMAGLVRLAALSAGLDVGTANIVFICVIGACVVAYLVIVFVLSDMVMPWLLKKLGFKERRKETKGSDDQTGTEVGIGAGVSVGAGLQPQAQTQSQPQSTYLQEAERMRQAAVQMRDDELESNIRLFQSYAHRVLGPFITPEEILRLDKYIESYARREKIPAGLPPLRPQELTNPDLFHFGWNMHNFFKIGRQGYVVPWLRAMFAPLKDMSPSTIVGKLKHNEHNTYAIPIVKDIERFMADQRP